MKTLKKTLIIALLIGLSAPVANAWHSRNISLRYIQFAERDLNYLSNWMETGNGIFNQLDKAKAYILAKDYDKAAVMLKAARNTLNGRLNGVLNKTFKNPKERFRIRAYLTRADRDLFYAERYLGR